MFDIVQLGLIMAVAAAILGSALAYAWRNLFDHYVFRVNGEPAAHIPASGRGILGRSTPEVRRTLRQFLIRALQSLGA